MKNVRYQIIQVGLVDKIRCLFLVLLAGIVTGCQVKKVGDSALPPGVNQQIKLVNINTLDRAGIATLISTLSDCRPKIIGIDVLFERPNDPLGDSALARSIRKAGNVVLVSFKKGTRIEHSHSVFLREALTEGLLLYGLDKEGRVSSFQTYVSVDDDLLWTFPVSVVSYFNLDRMGELMSSTKGNKLYDFHYRYSLDDFQLIDPSQGGCDSIADKIVLLGYLGPQNEDRYRTTASGKDEIYSTVIIANIISDLMTGNLVESD